LRERIAELEVALSDATEKRDETQAELAEARGEATRLETAARDAAARAEQLTDTKAELEQLLVVAASERRELERRATELESALEQIRAELSAGEHAQLLAELVRSRERLHDAERLHEEEHARLTRALFESSGDGSADDPLKERIAAEQSAKDSVEEARAEHERAWATAQQAVPGLEPSAPARDA
jgi:chromosome segregation ATPase